jgi:hypothetical protein
MNAVTHALLAVMANDRGQSAEAQAHIAAAQRVARTTARRQRQVVEIAALVIAGDRERASGLALVHTTEFADDADVLARLTGGLAH